MPLQRIQPDGLYKHNPPVYSHVVKAGNTIYIAGQVARDGSGKMVGLGDITAQATKVFENLRQALAAAGATFDDLVKLTIYIPDRAYRVTVNEVRAGFLTGPPPASTVIITDLASEDYLVQLDAIAVVE